MSRLSSKCWLTLPLLLLGSGIGICTTPKRVGVTIEVIMAAIMGTKTVGSLHRVR
jgi:hypothetical protein